MENQTNDDLQKTLHDRVNQLEDLAKALSKEVSSLVPPARDFIKERPLTSVAAGLGIGLLVGSVIGLLGSRR
ncbi:MAG: DUF883 C-terminal domain-containing protein [Bacteroidota bacterium]|nr:DUF883 C-terminal domain-containing protein [Bacteroidota bacterium]MDE2834616.1 DUF883 C-terminal domain-containing protein [Bacteroidota bacterium]MDE2957727.1 DUF883 C-terminal domain-containing protein [Bacteroidota bacterium]